MLPLTSDNFETEVLKAQGLVVVDYWGPKCVPCLALMPHMEKLAEQYQGRARFAQVNTAENRRLTIAQQVMGLPTIAFYQGGQKVAELNGNVTIKGVEEKLNELLA